MESLVQRVVILMLIALLAGPIAIGLTIIKTKNVLLTFVRRLIQAFFIAFSIFVGAFFLSVREVPLLIRLIGLYALSMGYIALRREYFPDVRLITPLLTKLGVKRKSDSTSRHGPVLKWRRNSGSAGNDGHGPEGEH
ncbi:MAG: hypothetical protein EXQ76_03645 [Candidatus Planktophila sp.]|nr:hypothetical protein [Candidatus Planktophila sp.]